MSYSYIEHTADVGIRAEGVSIEETVESAASAMLEVMFVTHSIEEKISVTFGVSAADISTLIVEVLNELLSIQDRHSLALKKLQAMGIKPVAGGFSFIGAARGEELDLNRHEVKTEVKAATYAGLKYESIGGLHALECVLDV